MVAWEGFISCVIKKSDDKIFIWKYGDNACLFGGYYMGYWDFYWKGLSYHILKSTIFAFPLI